MRQIVLIVLTFQVFIITLGALGQRQLIGVQNVDLRFAPDTVIAGIHQKVISKSERDLLNGLGITLIINANSGFQHAEDETGMDTMIINWSRLRPKFCVKS